MICNHLFVILILVKWCRKNDDPYSLSSEKKIYDQEIVCYNETKI